MHVSRLLLGMLLVGSISMRCPAQTPPPDRSALRQAIQQADAKLFDAYNSCDLQTLGSMVADDLEFFHDQTGLTTGKAPFLAAIQANMCGKVHRDLLPATLEVYPLAHYGAVELGVHRFSHPGHPEDGLGDARFVQVWQQRGQSWVITRVVSFEHNGGLLVKPDCER